MKTNVKNNNYIKIILNSGKIRLNNIHTIFNLKLNTYFPYIINEKAVTHLVLFISLKSLLVHIIL